MNHEQTLNNIEDADDALLEHKIELQCGNSIPLIDKFAIWILAYRRREKDREYLIDCAKQGLQIT